jgi:hypothetical protein
MRIVFIIAPFSVGHVFGSSVCHFIELSAGLGESSGQGDQIGRSFAYWVTVYIVQFFENYRSCTNVWATFSHGTSPVVILIKNEFGYILGDSFTNPSGHPTSRGRF